MNSQTERGVKYLVDMNLGVCNCNAGQDGYPCSHQAAIVRHFHIPSINVSPETKQHFAMTTIGPQAV